MRKKGKRGGTRGGKIEEDNGNVVFKCNIHGSAGN